MNKTMCFGVSLIAALTLTGIGSRAWALDKTIGYPGSNCYLVYSNWTQYTGPARYGTYLKNPLSSTMYGVCPIPLEQSRIVFGIEAHLNFGGGNCILLKTNSSGEPGTPMTPSSSGPGVATWLNVTDASSVVVECTMSSQNNKIYDIEVAYTY
jgi:hypothetical protein